MAKKPLPCPTLLRLLLDYDPNSGKLSWRPRKPWMFPVGRTLSQDALCRRWNTSHAGKEALRNVNAHGHKNGSIHNAGAYVHIVAWINHFGERPNSEIDHINSNPSDNRMDNLRAVSRRQNVLNTRPWRIASSRFKGVHRWAKDSHSPSCRKAAITVDGETKYVGYFDSEEAAAEAYNIAARLHFGEYTKLNKL